jgi:hypothetical protein
MHIFYKTLQFIGGCLQRLKFFYMNFRYDKDNDKERIRMKKVMGVLVAATLSTVMLSGCQNMSAADQRIGAAALGGALGGGAGNHVGGGVGAAAGAALGSKSQNGSNRNATYSGVGGAIGSAIGKSVFGGDSGAAIGGAIGGGAGAAIEQRH